jgi:hypothetical protein
MSIGLSAKKKEFKVHSSLTCSEKNLQNDLTRIFDAADQTEKRSEGTALKYKKLIQF